MPDLTWRARLRQWRCRRREHRYWRHVNYRLDHGLRVGMVPTRGNWHWWVGCTCGRSDG